MGGDRIFIRGLEARGIIGVEDWERQKPQTIRFDVDLGCDASVPAASDELGGSVNYRSVAKAILAHVDENAYHLVETLAERVAAMILGDFDVPWVRLRVSKPGAVRFSETVGTEIERKRSEV
ncbi:MAG: dihydroneopterin aldolase [Planctomycetota bacterium]